MPSNKSMNRALGFSKAGIEYQNFGIKYESDGIIKINRGFIQTWYYASSDFNTLLKRSDIGYYITTPEIFGVMNYSEYYGFYYHQTFKGVNVYFNFLKGNRLIYIKTTGSNTKNRFLADLEFYYSGKNFITNTYNGDDFSAYGFGIDITKEGKYKDFYFRGGVYNIFGFIDWKSVNYMYYHFDSNTTYVGEDGYLHQKPFGVGYYKKDINFYQKLPLFFKYNFEYKSRFGLEGIYSLNNRFNLPYFRYFIHRFFVKIGIVLENKNIFFGFGKRNWSVEFSRDLDLHTNFIKLGLKYSF